MSTVDLSRFREQLLGTTSTTTPTTSSTSSSNGVGPCTRPLTAPPVALSQAELDDVFDDIDGSDDDADAPTFAFALSAPKPNPPPTPATTTPPITPNGESLAPVAPPATSIAAPTPINGAIAAPSAPSPSKPTARPLLLFDAIATQLAPTPTPAARSSPSPTPAASSSKVPSSTSSSEALQAIIFSTLPDVKSPSSSISSTSDSGSFQSSHRSQAASVQVWVQGEHGLELVTFEADPSQPQQPPPLSFNDMPLDARPAPSFFQDSAPSTIVNTDPPKPSLATSLPPLVPATPPVESSQHSTLPSSSSITNSTTTPRSDPPSNPIAIVAPTPVAAAAANAPSTSSLPPRTTPIRAPSAPPQETAPPDTVPSFLPLLSFSIPASDASSSFSDLSLRDYGSMSDIPAKISYPTIDWDAPLPSIPAVNTPSSQPSARRQASMPAPSQQQHQQTFVQAPMAPMMQQLPSHAYPPPALAPPHVSQEYSIPNPNAFAPMTQVPQSPFVPPFAPVDPAMLQHQHQLQLLHQQQLQQQQIQQQLIQQQQLQLLQQQQQQQQQAAALAAAAATAPPMPTAIGIDHFHPHQLPPHVQAQQQSYSIPSPSYTPSAPSPVLPPTSLKPSTLASSLKTVVLDGELVNKFMELAQSNTLVNIETCGVLAAKSLESGHFHITHLVIPPQSGTENTCTTHNEDLLFHYLQEHDLISVGWIHTHPTQDCFMSSVDLHGQYSYQALLPEAIAIVVAPRYQPNFGIFALTELGMEMIGQCKEPGFHLHPVPSGGQLYLPVQHVYINWGNPSHTIVDLRQ